MRAAKTSEIGLRMLVARCIGAFDPSSHAVAVLKVFSG